MKRLSTLLFAIMATVLFGLFSYNSGYGYDALEYLVIGRSLLDGYRLYDFIPSKSWGLYALIAAFQRTGIPEGHLASTVLVTLIFLAVVALAFGMTRRTHDSPTALAAASLVALCAPFMEMNYLEPEGLVAACGLAAWWCAWRGVQAGNGRLLFLAGLWTGIGMAFKSVAGFYFPALVLFAAFWRPPSLSAGASRVGWLALGVALALALPAAYFAATGRLAAHVEWTYAFPLLHRPADLAWLPKLLTKLLWFNLLVTAALIVSVLRGIRNRVYAHPANTLALLMGLCALGALLRQQASHYVFPAAVFLCIFSAATFRSAIPEGTSSKAWKGAVVAAVLVLALMAGSLLLYNPRAIQRIVTLRDFSDEARLGDRIRQRVPDGGHALFFRKSTLLYWLSHTYPNIPLLKMDVQETYALRRQPGLLTDALDNPSLTLVECDPEWMGFQDPAFPRDAADREMIAAFLARLKERFVLSDSTVSPYVFWIRKETDPHTP